MAHAPLMPKATAVWLVENTSLSFQQIAEFCSLHPLEVQGIADGEVAAGIQGLDPTLSNQLTKEEIERCEKDTRARLKMKKDELPQPVRRTKGPRYTPVAKRQDKPDGVAFLLRQFPELKDAQVAKLIGTTKATIQAVRDRSHWNSTNIRPRDPVLLGLCSQTELNAAVAKSRRSIERAQKKEAKATGGASPSQPAAANDDEQPPTPENFGLPVEDEAV